MFKQQGAGAYIPTKSVIVKPEAQVDLNPVTLNQTRFLIPQYLGFIDPKGTTLNYNIKMSGRGRPVPNGRAGVHSLWRDFRLQDGTGGTTLEEIQDYNVLTSQWWGYTQNDSIAAKRNMMEGRQVNPAGGQNVYYTGDADWAAGAVTAAQTPLSLAIRQPIYSGILAGNKVFPVVATQGLRLQMTLDNLQRSLVYPTGGLGIADVVNNAVVGIPCGLKVQKSTGDDNKAAIGTEKTCTIQQPADGPGGEGVNRNATPFNNNPWDIGDLLFVSTGANTESLGVITGFDKDGDNDLQVTYIPNRANNTGLTNTYAVGSSVFVKSNDRVNGVTIADVPQANIDIAEVGTNFVMSDVEMVCAVVSPPQGYVQSLMSQMGSSKGLAMDFKTYSLYRVNLNAVNGLTNQLIPATAERAYSCLSIPLAQSKQLAIQEDSLQGQVDGCQNYQYVFGGHLIPDRPIDLVRYTNLHPHTDALHLIELEKSLVNCGYGVRNLQRVPERFLIGRAFSKYGQVSNLNGRDLSLRVEYSGATEQKLFNHYVCHLRRMVVNPQGVNAF
tara:strand:+ start:6628 stop:8286 length:1659 start_codon:yes stop_codon:yes gene_type:complete